MNATRHREWIVTENKKIKKRQVKRKVVISKMVVKSTSLQNLNQIIATL